MSDTPRHLVLGTAGHIDHGKTTLVKALTGIDCDRLTEEKSRGITIDIGFAFLDLPPAVPGSPPLHLAIVDVPGHRRFIRNMAAGAAGIDLLLLVVAADDGVMPQTIEHLHIARLLGVRAGVIALNKADLVEPDLLELVQADVEDAVQGTFLAGAPVVPVSAATGSGLPELRLALAQAAATLPERSFKELFRLPIDRSFSIKGAGTVITGTIISGSVKLDAEVELLPAQRKVRVRGIQVHGAAAQTAHAGQRAALNLAGVDKDAIQRGDVLAAPGSIIPTTLFDADVQLLPGRFAPLRRGSEALLHAGTAEIGVKLYPLDTDVIHPGHSALVQLRTGEPLALAAGDHFILRHTSTEYTLGGGAVLDAHPQPHRRQRGEAAEKLAGIAGAGLEALLAHEVLKAQYCLDLGAAAQLLNATPAQLEQVVQALADSGLQLHRDGRQAMLTLPENRTRIILQIEHALSAHHEAHPLASAGLSEHDLARAVQSRKVDAPLELFRACLRQLLEQGRAVEQAGRIALPGRSVSLSERERRAIDAVLKQMRDSLAPPQPDEFAAELPVERGRIKHVLEYMEEQRLLVQAPGGVYFAWERAEEARGLLREFLEREGGITVSQFGQLIGSSRKYCIPLLQLFEQDGMLIRDGDLRRLAMK